MTSPADAEHGVNALDSLETALLTWHALDSGHLVRWDSCSRRICRQAREALDRLRQREAALQGQIDMMEAEIAANDSEWAVAHLGAKVRLLNRVLDAARDLHRISGHNLPGWVACTGPRPCAWERLDMALSAVAQAEQEQA